VTIRGIENIKLDTKQVIKSDTTAVEIQYDDPFVKERALSLRTDMESLLSKGDDGKDKDAFTNFKTDRARKFSFLYSLDGNRSPTQSIVSAAMAASLATTVENTATFIATTEEANTKSKGTLLFI
jgi:hypothetical protein